MSKSNKTSKAQKRWKRRQKQASENRLQRLVARLDDGVEYRINTGSDKMSDRLAAVAEPLMEDILTVDDAEKTMQIAATGWNMAILPADIREDAFRDFAELGDATDEFVMRALVQIIIDRKTAMFPDDQRCIRDVHIEAGHGEWHVQVAYELEPLAIDESPAAET